jgi:hypothetical protein
VPDLFQCYFEKECVDLPLDFDENIKTNIRSTSFYHETEHNEPSAAVDGSTGAGPIDHNRHDSFFYYNSTVEVFTTVAD